MDPIEFGEFLRRVGMDSADFGLNIVNHIEKVVSLRKIKKPILINSMPEDYLFNLLRSIGTAGDPERKVYSRAEVLLLRMDPNGLMIGQTFVSRPKYIAIMENFKNIFNGFTLPRGLSKLTPLIVIGKDNENQISLAHYIPPIFEVHAFVPIIMDGIHRDFIILNAGTTIQSVVINNIQTPFPCRPMHWSDIKVVDVKPERMEDRYFDLNRGLFRDLKSVGIDG